MVAACKSSVQLVQKVSHSQEQIASTAQNHVSFETGGDMENGFTKILLPYTLARVTSGTGVPRGCVATPGGIRGRSG